MAHIMCYVSCGIGNVSNIICNLSYILYINFFLLKNSVINGTPMRSAREVDALPSLTALDFLMFHIPCVMCICHVSCVMFHVSCHIAYIMSRRLYGIYKTICVMRDK